MGGPGLHGRHPLRGQTCGCRPDGRCPCRFWGPPCRRPQWL